MTLTKMFNNIVTFGPIGYLPVSGTISSALALLFVLGINASITIQLVALLIIFFIALLIIPIALPNYTQSDPKPIVIDEFVGYLVASVGLYSIFHLTVTFMLFRFFDISKRPLIWKIETMPGAWGILLDDIVAGCFARLVMQILLWMGILF